MFPQEAIRTMEKQLIDEAFNRSIVEECLIQREKRLGIEWTHDNVERCLLKVWETLK